MSFPNFTYKVITEDGSAFSRRGLLFFIASVLASASVVELIPNLDMLTLWLSDLKAHMQQKWDAQNLVTGEERGEMGENDDREISEEEQVVATSPKTMKVKKQAPKKPFEFRERLWHEPPEMDYSITKFMVFCRKNSDMMVEEFERITAKEASASGPPPLGILPEGGLDRELEWRTNWLDSQMEGKLAVEFWKWAKEQVRCSSTDKHFYEEFEKDLGIDSDAVVEEGKQNNERDGKDMLDLILLTTIREEVEKKVEAAKPKRPSWICNVDGCNTSRNNRDGFRINFQLFHDMPEEKAKAEVEIRFAAGYDREFWDRVESCRVKTEGVGVPGIRYRNTPSSVV